MKTYVVALYISTFDMSLDELTRLLGREGDSDSRDRQWVHPPVGRNRQPREVPTIWKLESGCEECAPIEDHIAAILRKMPPLPKEGESTLTRTLDIAVMFDTPMCSFSLSHETIGSLAVHDMGLEVTVYPSDFSES
jgi:hypothetical protein